MSGRYIQDIVNEPGFERIRSEIIANVDFRAREAQEAFKGLMTFCGVIYSGGTIAVLGFIGSQTSSGVPYISLAAFAAFVLALLSFAVLYQTHSQLLAARFYDYAITSQEFFTRKTTLEEVLAAGHRGQAKYLYKLIFWIPLALATFGFFLGGLGALAIGPHTAPIISHAELNGDPSSNSFDRMLDPPQLAQETDISLH